MNRTHRKVKIIFIYYVCSVYILPISNWPIIFGYTLLTCPLLPFFTGIHAAVKLLKNPHVTVKFGKVTKALSAEGSVSTTLSPTIMRIIGGMSKNLYHGTPAMKSEVFCYTYIIYDSQFELYRFDDFEM